MHWRHLMKHCIDVNFYIYILKILTFGIGARDVTSINQVFVCLPTGQ
jgi:hypothetical protein